MNNKELLMDFIKFHYKENPFRQELTNEQDVDAYLHQQNLQQTECNTPVCKHETLLGNHPNFYCADCGIGKL